MYVVCLFPFFSNSDYHLAVVLGEKVTDLIKEDHHLM